MGMNKNDGTTNTEARDNMYRFFYNDPDGNRTWVLRNGDTTMKTDVQATRSQRSSI